MDEKDKRIAELEGQLAVAMQQLKKALERIEELERRLGLNSGNSSKPPSSDGYRKPSPKSLRKFGEKPSGGQVGHEGKTLNQSKTPDRVEIHPVSACENCQKELSEEPIEGVIQRQVFDIPVPKIEITEHQAEVKVCPCCGHRTVGSFPKNVTAPVQYGERVLGLAVYLSVQQLIPEDRLQMLFLDIFGLKIATSTLVQANAMFAQQVSTLVASDLEILKIADVKHLDESGIRIAGKTQWLHVISDNERTHYRVSEKRGNLLEGLKGTMVHDHWKPYFTLPNMKHSLCNAHHLRELKAVKEVDGEAWAERMTALLLSGNQAAHEARSMGSSDPPNSLKKTPFFKAFSRQYDRIIREGLRFHATQPPLVSKRKKRRVGHNLLLRLKKFKVETLRFLTDLSVPFTNNQAEQDIRMIKVKQKISGSFRTQIGAQIFCSIRSFISSARKQQRPIFQAILATYS